MYKTSYIYNILRKTFILRALKQSGPEVNSSMVPTGRKPYTI